MKKKKISMTFKIMKKLNLISSEERYGNINIFKFIAFLFRRLLVLFLYRYSYYSIVFDAWNFKFLRAKIWRFIGCEIGENVKIGHNVSLDYGFAEFVKIGDNTLIANRCLLLCHRRDISNFKVGDNPNDLKYLIKEIIIENNCQIGMGSIILPGVIIGEGAVVGANSLVNKNVEPWTVVAGQPAKLIKIIPDKNE